MSSYLPLRVWPDVPALLPVRAHAQAAGVRSIGKIRAQARFTLARGGAAVLVLSQRVKKGPVFGADFGASEPSGVGLRWVRNDAPLEAGGGFILPISPIESRGFSPGEDRSARLRIQHRYQPLDEARPEAKEVVLAGAPEDVPGKPGHPEFLAYAFQAPRRDIRFIHRR